MISLGTFDMQIMNGWLPESYVIRELKKTTFLTTRTLTGNKFHVFNQS